MERKNAMAWLLAELPKLEELKIIDAAARQNLSNYYGAELELCGSESRMAKYFAGILAIIGSVLIAGGIILIFNYNWDMFSRSVQVGIAFMPLLLSALLGIYTLVRNKGRSWCEASAILNSAGIGVLLALLSQIYHTGGELHEFMTLLLFLSLPLLYIFNSFGLSVLYGFGLLMVMPTGWRSDMTQEWLRLLLLLGVVPFIYYYLQKSSVFQAPMRYATLLYGGYMLTFSGFETKSAMLFSVALLFF